MAALKLVFFFFKQNMSFSWWNGRIWLSRLWSSCHHLACPCTAVLLGSGSSPCRFVSRSQSVPSSRHTLLTAPRSALCRALWHPVRSPAVLHPMMGIAPPIFQ